MRTLADGFRSSNARRATAINVYLAGHVLVVARSPAAEAHPAGERARRALHAHPDHFGPAARV